MNSRSILLIAGTRPEIIKLAPILLQPEKTAHERFSIELCVTGQHQTMSDEALAVFGLRENHNLRIMKPDQTPNDVSAALFEKLPRVFQDLKPDVVIVQGDTTSAAVAAICAFNMKIPVAHVEAGLRSHNLAAPFPEEMNRRVITVASRFNFCPTESAKQNLLRESVEAGSIYLTGNTIVDALRIISETRDLSSASVVDPSIGRPFVLVTAHRRESFGKGIENICEALKLCASRFPRYQFVYPVHLNPNVNGPVRRHLGNIKNVLLLPPVSYLNLLTLLNNCELVISDSGGIQEEAPSFRKYCVVLREVTERQESVDLGLSELVGTDPDRIVDAVSRTLQKTSSYPPVPNPYGDGQAARRILEILASQ